MKVYVLTWRYHDGSADGIVRVYADQTEAQEDMAMLAEMSDRALKLTEAELLQPRTPR